MEPSGTCQVLFAVPQPAVNHQVPERRVIIRAMAQGSVPQDAMQRLKLVQAWDTLNKSTTGLDDLLEAADDILTNSTASPEQQKKAAETIIAKSSNSLMKLKAQNKLKTIKLSFSVAAVVVDPDSQKYETMATPSDPAFAAYARNFEIGNFWYWFGTFWKEMPKADRLPILKAVVDTDGNLLPACQDLNTKNVNGLGIPRQDELRTLLKQMMGKGFTPWKIKAEKEAVETKDLLPKIDALGTQYHSVGFRGDARDPATLMAHDEGEFRPKVKSPFQVTKYNLDAKWNPFSEDTIRNTMYFREGQADNDLFTVVSIAKEFATATKFPLINDAPPELKVYPKGAKVVMYDTAGKTQSTVEVTVTQCYLYMVITGTGFDTEEKQTSKFPEIGVGLVTADKFLAYMTVTRIHYGETGDDGHTAYVSDYEYFRANKRKLLYEQNPDSDARTKFNDYVTNTYFHKFFEYNPLKKKKLISIEKCPYIEGTFINIYNRALKARG